MDYKAVSFKSADVEGRTVRGYAATWDADSVGDIILQGAFKKTLSERADRVKLLWEHSSPIGKPTLMREDDVGLYTEALVSKTRLGDEALELMRDGVIDQMSIGYSVPESKSFKDAEGIRNIQEIKLFEFSPVTFPANEKAFILSVKSINDAMKNKDLHIDDDAKKSLLTMIDQLHALLKSEPLSTQQIMQPPAIKQADIDRVFRALDNIKF